MLAPATRNEPLGAVVVGGGPDAVDILYDGIDILQKTTNGTVTRYVHGPGVDAPLAQTDGSGNITGYFHADALGSIVATTSAAGAVTATYRYDAYGNIEAGSPTTFAYTGREWDPEIGLYNYRARYYDPKTARFISEDPVREGVNFYAYAGGSPTGIVDPTGLTITYANDTNGVLQTFIGQLADRSPMVAATLALYSGSDRNLTLTRGDPGNDDDGGTQLAGAFHVDQYRPSYGEALSKGYHEGMTASDIEALADSWGLDATLTLRDGLVLNMTNMDAVETAIHELGHADHAARKTLEYKRYAGINCFGNGKVIPHDDRFVEQVANAYLAATGLGRSRR